MSQQLGRDLTVGSIPGHLMAFAMPMLLTNMLQTGYGIINTIWVGNIIGANAVGASAVSFPITFLLTSVSIGASMAATILVAQYYGVGDEAVVARIVANSFSIALILGAGLSILAILSGDFLLRLMRTPTAQMGMASGYLKITLSGFLLIYLGNLIFAMMRGIGETIPPLICMVAGVLVNAALDPLFIVGLGPFPRLGLNGAAYASLLSQACVSLLGLCYLNRKTVWTIFPGKLKFDREIVLQLYRIGFPSVIQHSLISIGAGFITGLVNTFGAPAMAAFGAGGRVDNIALMPAVALDMAAAALTAQNLGAAKPERVREIFRWGLLLTVAVTFFISLAVVIFPREILGLFGFSQGEKASLKLGLDYLRVCGPGYLLFAMMFLINGIINGTGHTGMTMILSLLPLWLVRMPLAWLLAATRLQATGIWIAIDISYGVAMLLSLWYYLSGNWKRETGKNLRYYLVKLGNFLDS